MFSILNRGKEALAQNGAKKEVKGGFQEEGVDE